MLYRESLKATNYLLVRLKMRSARHDKWIVSDQKIEINKSFTFYAANLSFTLIGILSVVAEFLYKPTNATS